MYQDSEAYIWVIMSIFILLVLVSTVFFCYRLNKAEKEDAEKGDIEKQNGNRTKSNDYYDDGALMIASSAVCDH
jgi:uncharacterized membrane protein